MKKFMGDDFLLDTAEARKLYESYAKKMPVIDFHNHLEAREIYQDKQYENLTQVWLEGDHYKWRLMRSAGIDEKYITGDGSDKEKYDCWVWAVEHAYGNPLYHWTHLELLRYFGIDTPLNIKTKDDIWNKCNAQLQKGVLSVRRLLQMQNVEVLCTTNDPLEDLEYHRRLREEGCPIRVLPTFRPDNAINMNKVNFNQYVGELINSDSMCTVEGILGALESRLNYFIENGCVVSDHSLESGVFGACDKVSAQGVLDKKLSGAAVSPSEMLSYQSYMIAELGKLYARKSLVMQLHIGALRNNSSRNFQCLGADTGFDSMNDHSFAAQISGLLDCLDKEKQLPKTIIYPINPKDWSMTAAMAANFNTYGKRGHVQLGAAWWFNDHKSGIRSMLIEYAQQGLLPAFVGMLTDSRSFLSFPRHEYFRRILCQLLGEWMENGEIPEDYEACGEVVRDICCGNAIEYFGMMKT